MIKFRKGDVVTVEATVMRDYPAPRPARKENGVAEAPESVYLQIDGYKDLYLDPEKIYEFIRPFFKAGDAVVYCPKTDPDEIKAWPNGVPSFTYDVLAVDGMEVWARRRQNGRCYTLKAVDLTLKEEDRAEDPPPPKEYPVPPGGPKIFDDKGNPIPLPDF